MLTAQHEQPGRGGTMSVIKARAEEDVYGHVRVNLEANLTKGHSMASHAEKIQKKRQTIKMAVSVLFIFMHFHIENRRPSSMASQLVARSDRLHTNAVKDHISRSIKTTTTSIEAFSSTIHSSGPRGQIAFRLHDAYDKTVNLPEKFEPVIKHLCQNTSDLPPILTQKGVLGFRVSISTNLKLVFIGDSIAGQLAQTFDTTVLDLDYDYSQSIKRYFQHQTTDIHVCEAESAPIRGGGVSAFMRDNYMISSGSVRQQVFCGHGEHNWGLDTVYSLLDHQYSVQTHNTSNHHNQSSNSHIRRVGKFNAAILEMPYGWIKDINSISKDAIIEEVNLVGKYFGAETIIISTVAMKNNVKRLDIWRGVIRVNGIIRELAKSWEPPQAGTDGVRWVLVQEFANFTNQLIWTNAKHIGYNVSTLDFSSEDWEGNNADFLMDKLQNYSRFWLPSIPMICAEKARDGVTCARNKISPDGAHWCSATVGPRYSASIACLLGCVYNGNWFNFTIDMMVASNSMHRSVRICEQECNEQFMSLVPVDEKWIESGTTLFSGC